jgi:tyrosyl-tRNA synthetase
VSQRDIQAVKSGLAEVLPGDGLVAAYEMAEREGRPLRVKFGIDPSGDELTIGHAVPLRKLRQFQDQGHTAVLIIGDFTGMVGDPTGKSSTRKLLSAEQTAENSRSYVKQALRILREDRLEIRRNSEWFSPMTMAEVLRLAQELTVAQLLQRDDFAKRYAQQTPISLVEFLYPLLQGYDSVAVRADMEIGGTDQTFNLLVGRTMQRAFGQREQVVLTLPLLEGLDGVNKMSKSLGNYISVGEQPDQQFGKVMSIPDTLVERYAVLACAASPEEVQEIHQAVVGGGPQTAEAKRWVGRRLVELYHGRSAAEGAEAAFNAAFRDKSVPADVEEFPLPEGATVSLPEVLTLAQLVRSRSAARQLIDQGAVRVAGAKVAAYDFSREELAEKVVQVGKRRSVRLVASGGHSS